MQTAHAFDLLSPVLSVADLILDLAQCPGVARLLLDLAKMTGATGVIVPINNPAWLPVDRPNQLRGRLEQMEIASAFPHFSFLLHVDRNAV